MKNILVLLIISSIVGCRNHNESDNLQPLQVGTSGEILSLTAEQLKTLPIDTVSPAKKKVTNVLMLSGKVDVDPDYRLSLSSALGGHIKSVHALPGKPVRKGEIIVELEDNQIIEIQREYLTSKARLQSAEADYTRQKDLNANKSASDKTLQLAEAEYKSLLAASTALEEKLRLIHINPASLNTENIKSHISITAPFNGYISRVMVNRGRYVSPSEVLVELINPEGLLLNLSVFEKDWPRLSVGQQLEAHTNQSPQKKIRARIISIGTKINEDGTAEIIARIVDPNTAKLISGLYVNVQVETGDKETYILPEESVVSFEGRDYVFEKVDANSFRMLEVSAGQTKDGITALDLPDAYQNKKFVSKGAYALLMAIKNTQEE